MGHDAGSGVLDASLRRDRSQTALGRHIAQVVAEHRGRCYYEWRETSGLCE